MIILFLLLPSLGASTVVVNPYAITVGVTGAFKGEDSELVAGLAGKTKGIINDNERKAFGIDDETLKDGIKILKGARPDDVFVRSPTPWGDLYKKFGWKQVKRITAPLQARLIDASIKRQLVHKQSFDNKSSKKININVALSKEVNFTMISSWPKLDAVEANLMFYNFSLEIDGGKIEYQNFFVWGQCFNTKKPGIIGSESHMTIELSPQQQVTAYLEAKLGRLEFEFDYGSKLSGSVAANYEKAYQNHHFYQVPVNQVISAKNLSNHIKSVHKIEMEFYYDANVIIKDNQDKVITKKSFQSDYIMHNSESPKVKLLSNTISTVINTVSSVSEEEDNEKITTILKLKKD